MRPTPAPNRWFRFSLRTSFIVIALAGTVGYWAFRHYAYEQALYDYEAGYAGWEAQTVTTADVCERSFRLFHAESAVPFASTRRAAMAHVERIEGVYIRAYGQSSEWLMGAGDQKGWDEAHARKAEIEKYYAEAKELAGE